MKRVRFQDENYNGADNDIDGVGFINTSYCSSSSIKWNSVGYDCDESDSSTASFSSDNSSILFHIVGTFESIQDSDSDDDDDDGRKKFDAKKVLFLPKKNLVKDDPTTRAVPTNQLSSPPTTIILSTQMDDDNDNDDSQIITESPQNVRNELISDDPNINKNSSSMETSLDVVTKFATTIIPWEKQSTDLKQSELIIASNSYNNDRNISIYEHSSISVSGDSSLSQKETKNYNLTTQQSSFNGLLLVEINSHNNNNNNNNNDDEMKDGEEVSFKSSPEEHKIMLDKAAGREDEQQSQQKEKETKEAYTNQTNQECMLPKQKERKLDENKTALPKNTSTMLAEISTISTASPDSSSIDSFNHCLASVPSTPCDIIVQRDDTRLKIRFLKQKLRLLAKSNTPNFFKQFPSPTNVTRLPPEKQPSRDLHRHEQPRVTLQNSHMNPKIYVLKQKLRLLKEKNDFSKHQKKTFSA